MKGSLPAFLIRHSSAVIALSLLAGCADAGQTYAKSHPELSAVQRRILATGRIPNGTAVAGLTKEQVRIAVGSDPATFEKAGGEDVWIFSHKKAVAKDPTFANTPADAVLDRSHGYSETDTEQNAPRVDVDVNTSVYFQGDIATRAETKEIRPQ
jgi:hypothetical protein